MNQSPDVTRQQLQDVLSGSTVVSQYAQAIATNFPVADNDTDNLQGLALHWMDQIAPKIQREIPQSAVDFYEQLQLTCNNIKHVTDTISQDAGGLCEELRYAICDTLYDTLVQTGMHQKTITDLLSLIDKYVVAISAYEKLLPAGDAAKEILNHQLLAISELQMALQTLLKAWNITKLKFSTIISDMDGVTINYSAHFEQLNLETELAEWRALADFISRMPTPRPGRQA